MGQIVDVHGNPINTKVLTEEIATPQLTGVRQIWERSVASGMTPDRLAALLERSSDMDPRDLITLAEDIEERDTHYYSVLSTRKLTVDSIDVVVEAASDDSIDVKMADAVRDMMALDCVAESRMDLLDGIGKSFAVSEIIWDRSEGQWQPACIEHRDQRWFHWDRESGRELRLRDLDDPINGLPLEPFKFITHIPRLRAGLPIRNGLARIVAFSWLCKAYALKNWIAFAEVFGMPVRVGQYDSNATPGDIRVLRRAVASIGSDAACVIPRSMNIEFIDAGNRSGGGDLYKSLCNYLDDQTSKAVLGQTSTADAKSSGLGSNQANVHNEVRGDIRDADSTQLATTYNRYLVKPFVDLHWGPQKRYPRVLIRAKEPEDTKLLAETLERLVPMGLKVEQSVIRDRLGLPDPDPKGDLLTAPSAAPAGPALNQALNRAQAAPPPTAAELLADRMSAEAAGSHEAWLSQIREVVMSAESPEALRDALLATFGDLPPDRISAVMQAGFAVAELVGRYDVDTERAGSN